MNRLLLLVLCLVGAALSQNSTNTCSYGSWDLTPLMYSPNEPSPASHSLTIPNFTFYVNFCERVSDQIGNGACNVNDNAGACQESEQSYSFWDIGQSASMEWVDYKSN